MVSQCAAISVAFTCEVANVQVKLLSDTKTVRLQMDNQINDMQLVANTVSSVIIHYWYV